MNDQRKTKKQLLEELEQERERSTALQVVSSKVAGAHDTDDVLDLIVNEAARLVGAFSAYLTLLDDGVLVPSAATKSAAGLLAYVAEMRPNLTVETGTTIVGHAMATKKPVNIEDVQSSDLPFADTAASVAFAHVLAKKFGFHGTTAVPLLANDRSIGVLVLLETRVRRFTENEISLLTAFANQASLALEKARMLNEAEREKERSDALYRVSNLLAGAHETDEVLDLIINEASRLLVAPDVALRLLEGDSLVLSQLGFGNCLRKRLRLLPFFRSVDVGGWQPWDENGMWSGWKGKNETSWND